MTFIKFLTEIYGEKLRGYILNKNGSPTNLLTIMVKRSQGQHLKAQILEESGKCTISIDDGDSNLVSIVEDAVAAYTAVKEYKTIIVTESFIKL